MKTHLKKENIRITQIIEELKPDKIIHLASMAGVRYSIEHQGLCRCKYQWIYKYIRTARKVGVKQIVYASSSNNMV